MNTHVTSQNESRPTNVSPATRADPLRLNLSLIALLGLLTPFVHSGVTLLAFGLGLSFVVSSIIGWMVKVQVPDRSLATDPLIADFPYMVAGLLTVEVANVASMTLVTVDDSQTKQLLVWSVAMITGCFLPLLYFSHKHIAKMLFIAAIALVIQAAILTLETERSIGVFKIAAMTLVVIVFAALLRFEGPSLKSANTLQQ